MEALVSEKSGRNMTFKHKYVFEAADVGAFPAATLQVTSQKWKHPFYTALSAFTDTQRETGAAGPFVYVDLSLRDDVHERDVEGLLEKIVEVFESVAFEHFTSDLDVSGPGVLGECLRHIVGRDNEDFSQDFVEELHTLGFHLLHSELLSGTHLVRLDNGTIFVSVEHGGRPYDRRVSEECDPGEHYSMLHKRRGIYRQEG